LVLRSRTQKQAIVGPLGKRGMGEGSKTGIFDPSFTAAAKCETHAEHDISSVFAESLVIMARLTAAQATALHRYIRSRAERTLQRLYSPYGGIE